MRAPRRGVKERTHVYSSYRPPRWAPLLMTEPAARELALRALSLMRAQCGTCAPARALLKRLGIGAFAPARDDDAVWPDLAAAWRPAPRPSPNMRGLVGRCVRQCFEIERAHGSRLFIDLRFGVLGYDAIGEAPARPMPRASRYLHAPQLAGRCCGGYARSAHGGHARDAKSGMRTASRFCMALQRRLLDAIADRIFAPAVGMVDRSARIVHEDYSGASKKRR